MNTNEIPRKPIRLFAEANCSNGFIGAVEDAFCYFNNQRKVFLPVFFADEPNSTKIADVFEDFRENYGHLMPGYEYPDDVWLHDEAFPRMLTDFFSEKPQHTLPELIVVDNLKRIGGHQGLTKMIERSRKEIIPLMVVGGVQVRRK